MIKIENVTVYGWEEAIRGMRNPKNSWDRSDSIFHIDYDAGEKDEIIGPNDHDLMSRLAAAGKPHSKYRRMIIVYLDVVAPLYWWKEFDTYKVGTVGNSCSTMHKIAEKEFTLDDFSHEYLDPFVPEEAENICIDGGEWVYLNEEGILRMTIHKLNYIRDLHNDTVEKLKIKGLTLAERKHFTAKAKCLWYQMIQLLPSSYNQRRTIMLNYEVLSAIYYYRKFHKQDEWREFCAWIESLPYSELITCNGCEEDKKK